MSDEREFYHLQEQDDAAADWTPEGGAEAVDDVSAAWSMAAHLCKMHRYHLRAYLGWGHAYGRGLCTESELYKYLTCYAQADKLGISWRGWIRERGLS